MLSVFRRPSPKLCLALARSAFSPHASASGPTCFAFRRNFASKPKQGAPSYTAAVLDEYDKPLVLARMTNDTPLGTDMVRVGVHYCSLNLTDVYKMSRTAESDDELLPQVPGCEFSGEVLEVGDYVTEGLKVGDKVVALLSPDHQLGGGLAGESVVSELDCFQTGDVSTKDAAVLINGHGSAYLAFTRYCQLEENDVVIVIAGTAGLGLAAIQLAKNVFKAKVYVIADTENNSSLIRDEGAHRSICSSEGLTKVYKFLESSLNGKKAKLVYDAVGQGLMYVAADFVDPKNGYFFSVDPKYNADTFPTTKPDFKRTKPADDDDPDAFVCKIKQVDLYKYRDFDKDFYRQIIQDTLDVCADEIIVPYTSSEFGLFDVNKAVEFIRSKKCTGKVLIDVRRPKEEEENDDPSSEKDKKAKKAKSEKEDD